ncbi:DUF3592 domain-containing protein [Corallococcus macrosporus]|uniref:DUF3592 domain-containing protein n=1 Tax=Corallococcus macrosporus TaxID=35 RepID=A0ABS3DMD6_9BACT|nr:DUF3592 domain-containing protein [Corallococcus macrosporus]MBN8232482.1 DUF3592 domain-containing protein [Corallococcus macrosporus]
MQLAIPHAPRRVRLAQVPGAVARLVRGVVLGLVVIAVLGLGAGYVGRYFVEEQRFTARAELVDALVGASHAPPWNQREDAEGTLDVLYTFAGEEHSVSGVRTDADHAASLGHGARVQLLVDPSQPGRPREATHARARAARVGLLPWGLGLGLLVALAGFAWEVRRLWRREVVPLRLGALVWLTPDDGYLPEGKGEAVFPAHFFRQDVKHPVRARCRPQRAPVRNGGKVLAAVVPGEPGWCRVIDEELARTLGWVR